MKTTDIEALARRVSSGDDDAFESVGVTAAVLTGPEVDPPMLAASEALLRALLQRLPALQRSALDPRNLDCVPLGPSAVDLHGACIDATRDLQAGLRAGYRTVGASSETSP